MKFLKSCWFHFYEWFFGRCEMCGKLYGTNPDHCDTCCEFADDMRVW